jgi:hypothetical protein
VTTWSAWLEDVRAPRVAALGERERRLLAMLHFDLRGNDGTRWELQESIDGIWRCAELRGELSELLALNMARRAWPSRPTAWLRPIPLETHARYTRDEIRAALGELDPTRPWKHREGVLYSEESALDGFFVTLRKDERFFSPSTSYRDYAISDRLFHWESQGATTPESPTGQRYLHHRERGSRVALFVRETSKDERGLAVPFVCLGLCDYVRHEGRAPIAITWRLQDPMPGRVLEGARAVAG